MALLLQGKMFPSFSKRLHGEIDSVAEVVFLFDTLAEVVVKAFTMLI